MPTNHEAVAALPVATAAAKQLLRDLLVRRLAYVVSAASEVPDLVAVDPASGAGIIVIICLGRNYLYDSTDTTTAHDGTSCLVSNEGRRYKLASGTDVFAYSVISKILTAPPGSPAIGDAYLVAPGGTGAWSGKDNQVAIFTARGWEFVNFGVGRLLYIQNIDSYYHKNAGGSWVAGFGGLTFSANSIPLSAAINFGGFVPIENQTTNAPPASPTVGTAYVIGPAPTGSWSGQAAKLAICEIAGSFTIYPPAAGWRVYDKAQTQDYQYSGTAWSSAGGSLSVITTVYTANGTHPKAARLVYAEVWCNGPGGGGANAAGTSGGTSGTATSFGAQCAATGGTGGTTVGGPGGAGTIGDVTMVGSSGLASGQGGGSPGPFGGGNTSPTTTGRNYGGGGGAGNTTNGGGGGGGAALATLLAAAIASNTSVTVPAGAPGAAGGGGAGANGASGIVVVREFVRA